MTSLLDALVSKYTTADALFAFLRSPAGGLHMVIEEVDSPVAIIYYDKRFSTLRDELRSVIWNKTTNRPFCVSPGYGHKFGVAVDHGLTTGSFITEEFIDGVMINQFHDGTRWRLASHTQLDAEGSFYGKRPFAELFNETFAALGLSTDQLTPGLAYSWVLQHPEERVVASPPYGIPVLRLVKVYSAASAGELPTALKALQPQRYALSTLEDVKEFVVAEGRRKGFQFKGVCLKTATNQRYKLRSMEYEAAAFLRGNQAKRAYTWLDLWSTGSLPAYLRIYPEEQCDADAIIGRFKDITQEAHELYLKVYRAKELPLGQAPQKYRKLLWDAHKTGKGAYFPNFRQFMNVQDTPRKLWLVNYESRYGATEVPSSAGNAETRYPVTSQEAVTGPVLSATEAAAIGPIVQNGEPLAT